MPLPLVTAKLRKGNSKMGFTPYFIYDEEGSLLHTEPVCIVPDDWHEWFKRHIEVMEFDYWGLPILAS